MTQDNPVFTPEPTTLFYLTDAPSPGDRCKIVAVQTRNVIEGVYIGRDSDPLHPDSHLFIFDFQTPPNHFAVRFHETDFFWIAYTE